MAETLILIGIVYFLVWQAHDLRKAIRRGRIEAAHCREMYGYDPGNKKETEEYFRERTEEEQLEHDKQLERDIIQWRQENGE